MRLHFAHFLREISDIDYDRDGFIIFDPVGDDQLSSRNFFLFLTARLVFLFFFLQIVRIKIPRELKYFLCDLVFPIENSGFDIFESVPRVLLFSASGEN